MNLECGRIEQCAQCVKVREPYSNIICVTVAQIASKTTIDKQTSIEDLSDEVNGFIPTEAPTNRRMNNAAFLSLVTLLTARD